jgi:subtilase family serine protease
VLAAGGTTLDADPATGAYLSETAWHTPPGTANPQTSGGGFGHLFARPAYPDGVAGIGTARGVPDVASDAAGRTGMTLAVSAGTEGYEVEPGPCQEALKEAGPGLHPPEPGLDHRSAR